MKVAVTNRTNATLFKRRRANGEVDSMLRTIRIVLETTPLKEIIENVKESPKSSTGGRFNSFGALKMEKMWIQSW
jgi:hypothetical protein